MAPRNVLLPQNLVLELQQERKSVYDRDYCSRNHRRRGTAPARSYTAKTKATNTFRSRMPEPLSDHFTTYPAALAMGYSRRDFEDTLGNTTELVERMKLKNSDRKAIMENEDTERAFVHGAGESLKKIERSWIDEAGTGKRERGNIYGLAGKKVKYQPRKGSDSHQKTRSLPGLDNWLTTANEYEKQVVHKFISTMKDAYQTEETARPHSTPARMDRRELTKPKQRKTVRVVSAPKSPPKLISASFKPPGKELVPSPPRSPQEHESRCSTSSSCRSNGTPPPSPQDHESRCSTSSSCRSNGKENIEYEEERAEPTYKADGLRRSPPPEQRRPASCPTTEEAHSCHNCQACRKKLLKKMVKEMSSTNLSSYEDLLKEKARNMKNISSKMYQLDEYVYPAPTFHNVSPRKKTDFCIHPEFVSESVSQALVKRKLHAKYRGQ